MRSEYLRAQGKCCRDFRQSVPPPSEAESRRIHLLKKNHLPTINLPSASNPHTFHVLPLFCPLFCSGPGDCTSSPSTALSSLVESFLFLSQHYFPPGASSTCSHAQNSLNGDKRLSSAITLGKLTPGFNSHIKVQTSNIISKE